MQIIGRTLALLSVLACGLHAATQPNIVFIIADDCTHRDIGCYGGQAHTPVIDQLAGDGMRFTRCFQAAPMCSPTRHNIYTGLYPVKSGAYPNHTFVKPGVQSVVQYLKPLGYRLALSGKKHIAPKEVFDFEYSGMNNNPDFKAVEKFVSDCGSKKQPFCLFLCSNEPHEPWNKGDPSAYPPEKIKLPPYMVDTPETRAAMQGYLAEITYFDGQVGEALALLDKHGLRDNTLLVVVSEQGNSLPFAKWTCYDSGLQSACIVRWPGKVKPGIVSNAMIEYVDFLPTFVEAAGGRPAELLDGRSILPVLTGEKTSHKTEVYGIMTTNGIINGTPSYGVRSVRSEQYKLIVNLTPEATFQNACSQGKPFKSWQERAGADPAAAALVKRYQHRPAIELYDVNRDPLEMANLAANPEYAPVIAELRGKLDAWMKRQGDLGEQTELEARKHQHGGKER